MSRRVPLPTDVEVTAALHTMLADAAADGVRPTVLTLARRLGMSNTTFWRRFPDTARQVRAAAQPAAPNLDVDDPAPAETKSSSRAQQLQIHAREKQQLREQLDLASAHIARLTLTNQRLVEELEAATRVTPLFQGH